MDIAVTTLAERVARTLAGLDHSANAAGAEASAATAVDETWRAYLAQADAVLRTIREPSTTMSIAGDPAIWSRMVDVAIMESEGVCRGYRTNVARHSDVRYRAHRGTSGNRKAQRMYVRRGLHYPELR